MTKSIVVGTTRYWCATDTSSKPKVGVACAAGKASFVFEDAQAEPAGSFTESANAVSLGNVQVQQLSMNRTGSSPDVPPVIVGE